MRIAIVDDDPIVCQSLETILTATGTAESIQKRSGEVWQLLGAVKTEFDKFGQGLSKMQQRLRQTDEELDNLIGVRSRAISRKLRAVQTMDESAAAALLELDAEPGKPVAARLPENGEEL